MKKIFLMVAAMACVFAASAAKYVKVTSAPEDWSGEYVILYEATTDSACVFSGVDAANGYVAAIIADNAVEGDFVTITIAAMEGGYSLLVNGGANDGKYMGGNSSKNALSFNEDATLNTIAKESTGVVITSGRALQYNNGKSGNRFRYYIAGGQQPIQLYKLKKETSSPVPVTSIELINQLDTIEVGESVELRYTIVPDSATDQRVEFGITGGSDFATLEGNVLTGVAAGDVTVVVTALDSLKGEGESFLTAYYSIHVKEAVLNTCAEVNAETTSGVAYNLNPVTVVYVNGANIYVKDETGSALVYMFDNGLTAGDVVSNIRGTSSPYKGLPELKPTNAVTDWTVVSGDAPEIPVATAAPVAADVNKIMVWNDVKIEGEFTTSASNLNAIYGTDTIIVRNNFKIAQTFSADSVYSITAAVAINETTVQIYFISATYAKESSSNVPVTSIELINQLDTIEVGESVELLYTIVPDSATDQRVEFGITDGSEFATLEGNVLTGVAAGDVEVRIMALDSLKGEGESILTGYYSIHITEAVLNTCAEVNAETESGVAYNLNPVTVVYVNGSNIYVKDETGSALVYKYGSGLKAGDVVSNIRGTSSPYNGLPELKPTNAVTDWTIVSGEAPEIPAAVAAPVAADVNKVMVWNDVKIEGEFTTASATNLSAVYGADTIIVCNKFKIAQTFSDDSVYNITAAVATFNETIQVYFISAVVTNLYTITTAPNDLERGFTQGDTTVFNQSNIVISATPNCGYYFAGWNDGNTDNPRQVVVTQDTAFTAIFAKITNGYCGDNLQWNYKDGVLTIVGSGAMYDYEQGSASWMALFKDSITNVAVGNGCTSIGNNAFNSCTILSSVALPASIISIGNYALSGCTKISSIALPNGLENIGSYAFNGCTGFRAIVLPTSLIEIADYAFENCNKLYDVYCYAQDPPTLHENSFKNYSAYLHVPCDATRYYKIADGWSKFTNVECIGSEETETSDFTVDPGTEDATFSWPTEEAANSYSLTITKDGEVFCILTFNTNGQLTNIAFAPARNGEGHTAQYATKTAVGYKFTVTGLTSASAYSYTFVATNAGGEDIQTYAGSFTTKGGTPTEVETTSITNEPSIQKVLRDGQVLIIRDGTTYNMMGAEVK